jgi:hypothetical protein
VSAVLLGAFEDPGDPVGAMEEPTDDPGPGLSTWPLHRVRKL